MPLLTQGWQAINLDANDSVVISAIDGAARISFASGALAGQVESIPRGSWSRAYNGPAVLNVQHIAGVVDWDPTYRAELGASNGASVSLPINPSSAALWSDASGTALVPPSGPLVPVARAFAWADRPANGIVGQRILVSDLGTHQGGVYFKWTGTRWAPDGPQDLILDAALVAGSASTAEQILKQYTLPAGLLTSVNWFTVFVLWAKNGTTDAASNIRLRLGSTGTVADAQLLNQTGFIAANRTFTTQTAAFFASPTEARILGAQGASTFNQFAGSSVAYPQNFTTADANTNPMIVSLSVQMAGTTNLGQIAHVLIQAG